MIYSTCLGGSGYDVAYGLAANGAGDLFVAGRTASTDFPMQEAWRGPAGAADVATSTIPAATVIGPNGASAGVFAAKLNPEVRRDDVPVLRR